MERLDLKFINYSPDFKNESLNNRAINLLNDIRTKNVQGFEYFGFNDLALNFSQLNLNELTNFSNLINNQKITDIVIFCTNNDIQNFNIASGFLNSNDILKEYKIKYNFISNDEPEQWQKKYIQIKNSILYQPTTAFLFIGQSKYNEPFVEFIKLIMNKIQIHFGYYRALEKCFLISKQVLEKQLNFLDIEEKNKIIMPNILTTNYSFFAESNLFLLLLKGCDLLGIVEGYGSAYQFFSSEKIDENIAFQYAYVRSVLSKNLRYHMLTSNDNILNNSLVLWMNMSNYYYKKKNVFSYYTSYPNTIYTYGQFILDNNKSLYITYCQFLNEKLDYQLSDELNSNDGLEDYNISKLSQFRQSSDNGLIETLTNVVSTPFCVLSILDNSAISLGSFIAFIYWSWIYECYLDKINPFEL
ncbi:hypothetical protein [Mycoplasmopsis primatum]|uniref:hypothetical protein n=1 Tax=Mycoplasmopsis primatum TaxID=55604 RepID=UPI0004954EEB|nr:hypothetical protein [Mycoplasmopsis primatum]